MVRSKKKRKGGLPAKYAKMGFKKGWAAYHKVHASKKTSSRKYSTGKRRNVAAKPKRTTKRRNNNMNFGLGGSFGKAIIGGVAVGVANRFIPINIAGADYLLAGMLMKNKLMTDLGAITLGRSLAGSITGGLLSGGGNGNGGFGGY